MTNRFKDNQLILFGGSETYGRWAVPDILRTRPPESAIQRYRVPSNRAGRPDLISNDFYGTPLLDWFLIAFNEQRNPLNWPKVGTIIEIPEERIVIPGLL